MPINRTSFMEHLSPGLFDIAWENYNRNAEYYSQLLRVENSEKQTERMVTTSGLGLFSEKTEGDSIDYDTAQEAYPIEVTHTTYGLGFRITQEMYEDDLYRNMRRLPELLGISAKETIEIQAHSLINNGFSGSYTFGDGVALFSASHPLIGGGTNSNTFASATDLSNDSLRTAITQFESQTVDNRGKQLRFKTTDLIVAPSEKWNAMEILKSELRSDTAENATNPLRNEGINIIVDPYLTDADSWFLRDSTQQMLIFFWRMALELDSDVEFNSGDGLFKARMRFSRTVEDWRGWFGVQGA